MGKEPKGECSRTLATLSRHRTPKGEAEAPSSTETTDTGGEGRALMDEGDEAGYHCWEIVGGGGVGDSWGWPDDVVVVDEEEEEEEEGVAGRLGWE